MSADQDLQSASSTSPRNPRPLFWTMLVCLALIALAVGAASWYATTPSFEAIVRNRLVTTLEKATGGRVELGAFHWRLLHLEFEADNLTIHGLEAPGEVPYAHIDRLFLRAKIRNLWEAKIGLNSLEGDSPVFHLIVYPDGATNQPKPKTVSHHGSVTDTLFDLAVDHTQVTHGLVRINQQAIPFELSANDLGVLITYDPTLDHYLAKVRAADISAERAKLPPVHSQLELTADLSRTNAVMSQLKLQTGDNPRQASVLEASGSLNDYANPQFELKLKGNIDVREVEALTAVPGLSGVAGLQIQGKGNLSAFVVDGQAKITGAEYRIPEVRVSGVNGSTNIHLTQDEIALTSLKARLPDGGSVDGELHLLNWLAPAPAAPAMKAAVSTAAKKVQNLPAPPATMTGIIRAKIDRVSLRSVMEMTAPPGYHDLGFDTAASGLVAVDWAGTAADLKVSANVTMAAGDGRYGAPLGGSLDATYYNRRGAVDIRHLLAQTPGSHIQVQGSLGVYPLNRDSAIQADLVTTNLGEFDKTLADLGVSTTGMHGKQTGVQAIPVQLHGEAEFHGTVTGSLMKPDVKGHLTANNFDTVFDYVGPAAPPAAVAASTQVSSGTSPLPASPASETTPIKTTDIHWDHLDTQAEYTPEVISVQEATLLRGQTTIHVSGQLHAHQVARHSSYDDDSSIDANVSMQNAAITDLLKIAGVTTPVSGTLTLQARIGGSLNNFNGGGHVAILGGQIYGEDYRSLNTDLRFNGQELDATNLIFLQDGGRISGDGGYDLRHKTVHFKAAGSGFDLAHLPQLQSAKLSIGGMLDFEASGSGPVQNLVGEADLHVVQLLIDHEFRGSLDAHANLDRKTLNYRANSGIDLAAFQLTGKTELIGNYPTQAYLRANQLHLDRLFRLFNVTDVSSRSVMSLQATISGPAKQPKLMEGSFNLDPFEVSVGGVALRSASNVSAQLHNGVLHLDPLQILGDDTNMKALGSVAIFEESRSLDLHASGSVNLRLAQSFDPNITSSGHVDFFVDATGTLQRPNLGGQVKFTNVAMSLGDLPNGLSQMNGTLVFDQDRLTVQQLSAVTGGGRLQIGGSITYQQGIYGDLTATGKDIRIRYPQGVSSMANASLRLQGTETNLLLSGNVLVTRFSISPNLDLASLKSATAAGPLPDPNSPSNHVRLDVHITSAPELNFQNSFAKLAGDVDLRIRGTVADPSLLGHISITDGSATFAGTTYQLQRGEIYFSNPIHIDPVIDLDATARVEDYDIEIGVHGTLSKLGLTYRSEPPLPEADVFALLALGRTQEEQQIYSQEQQAAGVNSTADALLGGALNATVSNRVSKLFGAGSVKIDPTFVGNLGNSTARITVQEKIGKNVTVTYATNVNSTAQQLIAGQLYLTQNVSVVAQRDESGVFSLVLKIHQRRR
ncbi:hypothetical protein ACPOL_5943 [Acidisarcina polymorpha]|uniref:Translocation and assembly module TamB C-terminal domain-containing protein n=1 Tax=Acidisarcina polymorpha TaxID=2211140 RepID=A0A2Z5G8P1_9BACT|nr:translocation/assembly module TamB domain-containing protein [Acidisarcina polymorpha]AXC15187.1 hypothetical protein ACPOL_5943 [Acidisarcina polymorpha]